MKTYVALLGLIFLSLAAHAADNIICSGDGGSSCIIIDNAGNKWRADIGMKTNGSGEIFTLGDVASADNIIGVNSSSNRTLIDTLNRRWDAHVLYTTDGNGNVIPIPAGGGGGSATWGTIVGTLSDQTDLQAALDAKQNLLSNNPNTLAIWNSSGLIDTLLGWGVNFDGSLSESITTDTAGDFELLSLNSSQNIGGNDYGVAVNSTSHVAGSAFLLAGNNHGQIDQSLIPVSSYNDSPVAQDVNMFSEFNSGTVGRNFNWLTGFNTSAAPIAGLYFAGNYGNDATVADDAGAFQVSQNGALGKGWNGFSSFINADTGTIQSGNQITGCSLSLDGNHNSQSDIVGLNLFNTNTISTDNTISGTNVQNHGAGYRFTGASYSNDANMREEGRGFQYNDSGDSRTKTGLDIVMSGTAHDDAQGIRVNVISQLSTTQRVHSMELDGGTIQVQSDYSPMNAETVDVGNNMSATSTIVMGAPLTGTDQIIQLIQSNFIVHDAVSSGPIGLNTNMVGLVSQIGVDPGITLPEVTGVLLGTSVPVGSGGTISRYVTAKLIALPSFGGSVASPIKIGIEDTNGLLGQQFCDNASSQQCWFLQFNDPRGEVYFPRLALGTTSQVAATNAGLDVQDNHVRFGQTTAPIATVNANAGTGATCDATGSDTVFHVRLVTGTLGFAAGEQCSVAFNKSYNNAPICTMSPASNSDDAAAGSAAAASLNTYQIKSTTADSLRFANADVTSTAYEWDVHCYEN